MKDPIAWERHPQPPSTKQLLSGNAAVARAALDAGVALGTGYPGTPSTEILEELSELGGRAQWAPNEKVALEVALGVAFAGSRSLVTMKHVGLNVAADPLFTSAYTGIDGALVVVSADDPGMASSQNEQDNRHYARAAGLPMLEPADSREAYELTLAAFDISHRWGLPVILRLTTRVCHSGSAVHLRVRRQSPPDTRFRRDIAARVMIPEYARPAHVRLREKLTEIAAWSECWPAHRRLDGSRELGIITSGVTSLHVREAAPTASLLKLAMTHPLPIERIRTFAASVERCTVVEEGDPYLLESLRAAGIDVEGKPARFRFGELNVGRVSRILAGDLGEEPVRSPEAPPQLCPGCAYRTVFELLNRLDCIVAGDIGCYTLGVHPPYQAIDSTVCMGASIGVGLGLRHVLPEDEARRVVSVIGDSTFIHSGVSGLVEMIYNPPPNGHVLIILDNEATAMTGMQEHPGTGRTLARAETGRVVYEDLAWALGMRNVQVLDPTAEAEHFEHELRAALDSNETALFVLRHPCQLKYSNGRRRPHIEARSTDAPPPELPRGAQRTLSVAFLGLGGQGVVAAADVLAQAMFSGGYDVKKAAVHGMSQRGGSVTAEVRFGREVLSPLIPERAADYVVALDPERIELARERLATDGVIVTPDDVDVSSLANRRSTNIALLGVLCAKLGAAPELFEEAIRRRFPKKLHWRILRAFHVGRDGAVSKLERVAGAR